MKRLGKSQVEVKKSCNLGGSRKIYLNNSTGVNTFTRVVLLLY